MTELAKHASTGKPQVQDIDPLFILAMGDVLTQGLTKYPNDEDGMPNWWKGGDTRDFVGSIMRHAAKLASGEETDDESRQHHAAHIAVDAMFMWSWLKRGVGRDTRLKTFVEDLYEQNVSMETIEEAFRRAIARDSEGLAGPAEGDGPSFDPSAMGGAQ